MNTTTNLFEVKKIRMKTGLANFPAPEFFGVYKTTGGRCLGVVGKDYTPTQPQFIHDQMTEALSANGINSSVQFTEMKGGERVMFSAKVKDITFKNMAKKEDIISVDVAISTGYNGKVKTSMKLNTLRLICTNGMTALNTEVDVNYKNVKGNIGKANMLVHSVAETINQIDSLRSLYVALAGRKVTKEEHRQFILKVTGLDVDQYAEYSKRKTTILDAINESVAIEEKDAGFTAWTLMNGLTRYTNHMANFKSKDDYIYNDSGLLINNRAQHYAIELLS